MHIPVYIQKLIFFLPRPRPALGLRPRFFFSSPPWFFNIHLGQYHCSSVGSAVIFTHTLKHKLQRHKVISLRPWNWTVFFNWVHNICNHSAITNQWYQSSQMSHPIIELPSSGILHVGHIQIISPFSSYLCKKLKNVIVTIYVWMASIPTMCILVLFPSWTCDFFVVANSRWS